MLSKFQRPTTHSGSDTITIGSQSRAANRTIESARGSQQCVATHSSRMSTRNISIPIMFILLAEDGRTANAVLEHSSIVTPILKYVHSFLKLSDAMRLRRVSRDVEKAVRGCPWQDTSTKIVFCQTIAEMFPNARTMNIKRVNINIPCDDSQSGRTRLRLRPAELQAQSRALGECLGRLTNLTRLTIGPSCPLHEDVAPYLSNLHTLSIFTYPGSIRAFSDDAFRHWTRLRALDITDISTEHALTDDLFQYLTGLHTLNMSGCSQSTITDAAFAHLTGLKSLNISDCIQFTDNAFRHLTGLHTLNLSGCSQSTITDAAFSHLTGLTSLNISCCYQRTITDNAFRHLSGLQVLDRRNVRETVEFEARVRFGPSFGVLNSDHTRTNGQFIIHGPYGPIGVDQYGDLI